MTKLTSECYELTYQCPRCRCDVQGVVYPPAVCPVCHQAFYDRHPEYLRLKRLELDETLPAMGYTDYTKCFC